MIDRIGREHRQVLVASAMALAVYRYSMLAGGRVFMINVLGSMPVSSVLSAWYASPAIMMCLIPGAKAVWGCYRPPQGKNC